MKLFRVFIFCSFLLGACSPASTPRLLPTAVPLASNTPFATDIPSTPTLSPTETATIPPATKTPGPISEIPSCTNMKAQEVISADYQIPGVMLSLDNPSYSSSAGISKYKASSLYHFDLPTRVESFLIKPEDYQENIKTKIFRVGVNELRVSPDFLKAVYLVNAYVDSDWEIRKSWLEIYDAIDVKKMIFTTVDRLSGAWCRRPSGSRFQ